MGSMNREPSVGFDTPVVDLLLAEAGEHLTRDDALRVDECFRVDFAEVFGCRCCAPAHATGERVERMRRPS
jgi:hypothetical protein